MVTIGEATGIGGGVGFCGPRAACERVVAWAGIAILVVLL
jgi:hypothetical protein